MANLPNRRAPKTVVVEARTIAISLPDIPAYQPINRAFSTEQVTNLLERLDAAHLAEQRAIRALNAARDAAVAAEWELHNSIIAVRRQAIAQFGDDSEEIRVLGLKKRSDYKRPGRTNRAAEAELV